MRKPVIFLLLLPVLSACGWMAPMEQRRQGASSSLVDFLYPDGSVPPRVDERMPHLRLPVRVGIAFVPSTRHRDVPEAQKQQLLQRVAEHFRDQPYVSTIDTIPETYMRSARGVQGMQQVATLYDFDIVALVSYDQVIYSRERDSALLYWTVVGTTLIKGNSNEVHTLIDTAVFDARTARILFRAPGTHTEQKNSTYFDDSRDRRQLEYTGFDTATDSMLVNLAGELQSFEDEVRNGTRVTAEWRDGGGGSAAVLALLVLLGFSAWRAQQACARTPRAVAIRDA